MVVAIGFAIMFLGRVVLQDCAVGGVPPAVLVELAVIEGERASTARPVLADAKRII